MRFEGPDCVRDRDGKGLTQYLRIFNLMSDGNWRTLDEISNITGDPKASVSAQLRHMRKERFGSHRVVKYYLNEGVFSYRLIINERSQ